MEVKEFTRSILFVRQRSFGALIINSRRRLKRMQTRCRTPNPGGGWDAQIGCAKCLEVLGRSHSFRFQCPVDLFTPSPDFFHATTQSGNSRCRTLNPGGGWDVRIGCAKRLGVLGRSHSFRFQCPVDLFTPSRDFSAQPPKAATPVAALQTLAEVACSNWLREAPWSAGTQSQLSFPVSGCSFHTKS